MDELLIRRSVVAKRKPTVNQLAGFTFGWNAIDRIFYGLADNGNGTREVVPIGGAVQGTPTTYGGFKGTCDLHTDPGVPSSDEWWSATEVGVYANFGNVEVTTMDEVFNYIYWNNTLSTWRLEVVPVNMSLMQIPKVVDGVWDLNVSKNLELEVNPYPAKKSVDPGFAYFYSAYPSMQYPSRTNALYLDGTLWASQLHCFSSLGWLISSPTGLNHQVTYAAVARNLRYGINTNYGNISADANSGESVSIVIGTKTIVANKKFGEYVEVDDYNQRFTINMTKIHLSKGTALKYLALDANKEVAYVDAPGGATPTPYTFDWDSANNRYAPYAAKKLADPGFPYFYAGYQQPTYSSGLGLDGTLSVYGLYSTTACHAVGANADNGWATLQAGGISHYASYQSVASVIRMRMEYSYGHIHTNINSSGKSAKTRIGATAVIANVSNGEYVEIDDWNTRFSINMTKILFNKGTASRYLAVDANKELVYTDSPALEVRVFNTENLPATSRYIIFEPKAFYAYTIVSLYCMTQNSAATCHIEKNSTVYVDFGFSSAGIGTELAGGSEHLPNALAINDQLKIYLPGGEGRCTFRLILKRTSL